MLLKKLIEFSTQPSLRLCSIFWKPAQPVFNSAQPVLALVHISTLPTKKLCSAFWKLAQPVLAPVHPPTQPTTEPKNGLAETGSTILRPAQPIFSQKCPTATSFWGLLYIPLCPLSLILLLPIHEFLANLHSNKSIHFTSHAPNHIPFNHLEDPQCEVKIV
jgi:hypothetical protein